MGSHRGLSAASPAARMAGLRESRPEDSCPAHRALGSGTLISRGSGQRPVTIRDLTETVKGVLRTCAPLEVELEGKKHV